VDTIFALASGRVKAGVSVLRLSGPRAFEAASRLAGSLPPLRRTGLRRLHGADGGLIDEALVLCFPEGGSFTGESVVELHVHGSLAVVSVLLRELGAMPGLRLADPGEFSRRALENDRLDLTQIEGLGDLIEAETEAQRRQALAVFSGVLRQKVDIWRADLIRAASLVEVTIDFADEDVPQDVTPDVLALVDKVKASLAAELSGWQIAERIREGFEVAIVGAPNAGKSTLLNALAGREAAITSEIAGTTRDVIEVRMDLDGLPVTFLDTAGLRDATDAIESIGISRAIERAEAADLRVLLVSGPEEDLPVARRAGDIVVLGKADLRGGSGTGLSVSGTTGEGLDALMQAILVEIQGRVAGAATINRQRHREALFRAVEALDSVRDGLESGRAPLELVAVDLRGSVRSLESLIGRVGVEDYLGEIFSSFCIGK
jgi:tRNA modification GTPase